jgi:uncharacterized membrane protein
MMASGFSLGYLNFTVYLLLLTGVLMLVFDVKGYELSNMDKERKAARFLGWMNVALSVIAFIGNRVYQQFFW